MDRAAELARLAKMGDPIETHAAELEARLTDYLGNGLAKTEATAADLANRLQGYLNVGVERTGTPADKMVPKLTKRNLALQGNAHQGVFQLGGRYPLIEDVITGLKTGDYFSAYDLQHLDPRRQAGTTYADQRIGGEDTVTGGGGNDTAPPLTDPGPTIVGGGGNDTLPGGGGGGGGSECVTYPNGLSNCAPDGTPCPPGSMWHPLDGCYGAGGGGGGGGGPPPTPTTCDQYIFVRCADKLLPPVQTPCGMGVQPVCYVKGVPAPDPSWVLVSYEFVPTGSTVPALVECWIPGGWFLSVDKRDATVYATERPCMTGDYCFFEYQSAPDDIVPPPPSPPPETCAPPPPLTCPPDPTPPPQLSDDFTGWCKSLEIMVDKFVNHPDPFGDWFGVKPGDKKPDAIGRSIAAALLGTDTPVIPSLVQRATSWASTTAKNAANAAACQGPGFVPVSLMRAAADFVQSYLHILPPQFTKLLEQLQSSICQYLIPTPAEADRAYLANAITKEEWECFQKAAGNLVDPREQLVFGDRDRPGPREIDLLHKRKLIDTDEFHQRMRGKGVMTEEDKQAFSDLNLQYPDKSDLIRFMVRDVFDQAVVEQSGLDTDFERKFTGDALAYADALGIPENHMRYAWRAHWQLPSLTMAAQMLARNRPGRVPDEAVVTDDDVVQLLKQDDWAPGWIPAMMEIVKTPLTRVDVRRMYQLHNATEQELKDYFLDLRYSDQAADDLVRFFKRQREVAEAKASGVPTQRTLTMQYARGEITEKELTDTLATITLTPALAQAGKVSAQQARTVYRRQQVLKGVKRQYVAGLVDDGDATAMLAREDIDADEITELLELWQLDKRDKGKHASGAQLCKWRSTNLISPVEQLEALTRTGWSVADAQRIVSQCEIEITDKQRRAAAQMQKAAEAALEKQLRKQKQEEKEAGRYIPPRRRKITVSKTAKGTTITDTESIPVPALDGDPATVADGL